ncbi:MAG: Rab6 family protein [archaeon]|nr:Rab6 family protein [archaeon]
MTTDEVQKYKLIFLGDQGVGKSSILNRFVQDRFEQDYQATIGLDFHSKNATINGANVRLLLYDTAGQEKFKSLIPMYIRDANIIIMVYDVTNTQSLQNTNHWVTETKDLKREDAIFVLVGNKVDLVEQRQVTEKDGENFAKENNFLFMEVSAKTGKNIIELFHDIIYPEMSRKFNIVGEDEETKNEAGNQGGNIELANQPTKKKKGGCCGGKKGEEKKGE